MFLRIARKFREIFRRFIVRREIRQYSRYQKAFDIQMSFTDIVSRFSHPNDLHAYMHHFFVNLSPSEIREHRRYFSQEGRGYGEDAFHAMWWLLQTEFRPKLCLEIGVFRGQVISLWGVISKKLGVVCDIHGISPFEPIGDTVSQYQSKYSYMTDTLNAFKLFDLSAPTLIKGLSTDLVALNHISSTKWDLIYIDGNHDYEVALEDYQNCILALNPGGLLVMDDSSLGTSFVPPAFSFAGHPGPSRVVAERAKIELDFLGAIGHNNVFRKPV